MVLNPNNWHWIEKNTLQWSKEYLETSLVNFQVPVKDDKYSLVYVKEIENVTGDSNVSQRKGKVICYYDMDLKFKIGVRPKDAIDETEDIFGTILIPEFMHDEIDLMVKMDGFQADAKDVVDEKFVDLFTGRLLNYQNDLIAAHTKDVQE
ncbi:hypothetical protein ACO0QE_001409 [Hanseniaspora vineae]